jgi:hypothetical protein
VLSTISAVGKKRLEKINDNVNAKTQVNKNVTIDIKQQDNSLKEYKCSCCGNIYKKQQGNFMPTNFELFKGNSGFITVCKRCTDQLFESLTAYYLGNEEKAIDHICCMFGLYFNKSPLAASKKISANRSRLSTYSSKIQIKPWIGKTYLDTITERAEEGKKNIIETFDEVKEAKKAKLKSVKFFGTGFSDDDYVYLQEQYDDWTTRHECKTKSQEEVFKRICFKQLEILKATRNGDNTKDLDRTFQDLLDTANLKPKQNSLDTLSDAQTLGTLLSKWETTRPLPEIDEDLKDVDKIGRYIDIFFRGHLAKMMGLKNGLSNLYSRFMKKYTVERPEYEGDENNEALFDAIFSNEKDV